MPGSWTGWPLVPDVMTGVLVSEAAQRSPRFIIFGCGRVGSSLLVDLLNSRRDIFCEYDFLDDGQDPCSGLASRVSVGEQLGASAYGMRLLVPYSSIRLRFRRARFPKRFGR